jgi:hypothetical protein
MTFPPDVIPDPNVLRGLSDVELSGLIGAWVPEVLPPEEVEKCVQSVFPVDEYAQYVNDPAGFAKHELQFTFTPNQTAMAEGLLKPPYRVLAPSANSQGKTSAAAVITIWWFCTRSPCIIRTTAPKYEQVKDLLWKEIRKLARRLKRPLPFLPKACRIERAEDDYAMGSTAIGETSAQGHHGPNQLFIFDEATGVPPEIWTATESMWKPPDHAWLAIFNPTMTTAKVYLEFSRVETATRREEKGGWGLVRMSALDHPNIKAELSGLPPPVPDAMGIVEFTRLLKQWSTATGADPTLPIGQEGGPSVEDVVWPPLWATEYAARTGESPAVYRPGAEAEARLLARFPSQGSTAVWGEVDWLAACRELPGMAPMVDWDLRDPPEVPPIPELGCDVARMGDDMTCIHARSGFISLGHETAAKRPPDQTGGRLMELCAELARWWNDMIKDLPDSRRPAMIEARQVPIKIDDDGCGGTIASYLRTAGYTVCQVGAGTSATEEERYPNKRNELWFLTRDMAARGELDLSRLDANTKDELRRQAMTAKWSLDAAGRRLVEEKAKQKKELGRSPDDIDAMNLAYFDGVVSGSGATVTTTRTDPFGRSAW